MEFIAYVLFLYSNIHTIIQIYNSEDLLDIERSSIQMNIERVAYFFILIRSTLILRIHDSTRYLIRMIIEVLKGMVAFLIILLFFQGLFSIFFKLMSMQNMGSESWVELKFEDIYY